MKDIVYGRWQQKALLSALKTRRVVTLAGARQCGKTTLAKSLEGDGHIYRTLDDVTLLEAAQSDPHGFVNHGDELMIIDEIQKAPILLQAVKKDVDENKNSGRFLLTGSANIQSLPGVSESLAGRVRKIRLRPLALGEIANRPAQFIDVGFNSKFEELVVSKVNETVWNKDQYLKAAFCGGYPEVNRFESSKEIRQWHFDYIEALIERDLRDIVNIKRHDSMSNLLYALAAWSSLFMDISAIGAGLGLARQTIESYINALEALYLVERVKPWTHSDYDRINKHDKLFMTDTGLMASILNWNIDRVRLDGQLNGKLIETFVFTQLVAQLEAVDEHCRLFHYRDREKREIDFVVENDAGAILAIEVKAGTVVKDSSFKHLKWFKQNMAKGRDFVGVVLYAGEHIASFGEDMWAVPIRALWG